jgi:hypothetical protein
LISTAIVNRSNEKKVNIYKGDPRIESMFTPDKQGVRQPISEIMKEYRPGSLLSKKGITLKRKKLDMDGLRTAQNSSTVDG